MHRHCILIRDLHFSFRQLVRRHESMFLAQLAVNIIMQMKLLKYYHIKRVMMLKIHESLANMIYDKAIAGILCLCFTT